MSHVKGVDILLHGSIVDPMTNTRKAISLLLLTLSALAGCSCSVPAAVIGEPCTYVRGADAGGPDVPPDWAYTPGAPGEWHDATGELVGRSFHEDSFIASPGCGRDF